MLRARRTIPGPPHDPDKARLLRLYRDLLRRFGPQGWWPGRTPFEVAVGAILTQHTAWTGAARAVAESVSLLRPGDVVDLGVPLDARLVIISVAYRGKSSIRVRGVDADGELHQFDAKDLAAPVHPVAHVELPVPYDPGARTFLDGCAALLDDWPSGAERNSKSPDRAVHPIWASASRNVPRNCWLGLSNCCGGPVAVHRTLQETRLSCGAGPLARMAFSKSK